MDNSHPPHVLECLVTSAFVNIIKSKSGYELMHMWQGGGVCYCWVFGLGGFNL